jgi:hypothetical protein
MTLNLALGLDPAISKPGAFVLVRRRQDGTLLYVAPRPNPLAKIARAWGQFQCAFVGQFFQASQKMAADLDRTMSQINALMRAAAPQPDPARLAGLEGRYYVRAALDPAYATPEALHHLVRDLLDGTEGFIGGRLPAADRRALAVTAMRGWETRGERTTSWSCGDLCQEGVAVGMQVSCSPVVRWRCEHWNPAEPPLVAHRLWAGTRVEVRCG